MKKVLLLLLVSLAAGFTAAEAKRERVYQWWNPELTFQTNFAAAEMRPGYGDAIPDFIGGQFAFGGTRYLNRYPILGKMKFGVDVRGEFSYLTTDWIENDRSGWENLPLCPDQFAFGLGIGPSFSFKPIKSLNLHLFALYQPTFSMCDFTPDAEIPDEQPQSAFAHFGRIGVEVTWKWIGVNAMVLFGGGRYKTSEWFMDEAYDLTPYDDVKTLYKTVGVSLGLTFKFSIKEAPLKL